jgi:hypothetical protein
MGRIERIDRFRMALPIEIVSGVALTCACCCSSVAGPTAPAASYSATLAPGELRFYDAEIPSSTTQINLDFILDSATIPLRLQQIDPSCLPAADDSCQSFHDASMPPRPAGMLRFGNTLQPHGPRTRIVLQNMSSTETVTYNVIITPHRAGCT